MGPKFTEFPKEGRGEEAGLPGSGHFYIYLGMNDEYHNVGVVVI